jgi:hypothetical protein
MKVITLFRVFIPVRIVRAQLFINDLATFVVDPDDEDGAGRAVVEGDLLSKLGISTANRDSLHIQKQSELCVGSRAQ